jgi:3-hydroxyacyl-[acyl-carrier-protein] dehydratase
MRASEHLPHTYPFEMLDTAEVVEDGKRGHGTKLITERDFYVTAQGGLPGVLVIEAMAHLSGIVCGRRGDAFLSALKDFEFAGTAMPGQVLEIESELEGEFGGMFIFHCTARAEGASVAEGRVVLKLGA